MMQRPSPLAVVPVPQPPAPPLTIWARVIRALSPAPKTSPANVPYITGNALGNLGVGGFGMVTQNTALIRPAGADSYRAYAQTPWVFAGINIRKDQVASSEWDIVPFDNTKRFPAKTRDRVKELFTEPSAKMDSFQSFAKAVVGELLVLDGAPIEKVRYPDGSIAELWPTRGDWVAVDERWDGSDPEKPRYYWVPDGTIRAAFRNDDMVYMVANPRDPNSSVGTSPMAVLQMIIESELQGNEYNRRQVMGAAPDGVLNIGESAGTEDVQKAEAKFKNKVEGQGAMAIIGGYKAPSWMPFRTTNRDMQFREWQDYLIRCIAVVLALAPMDLGITFDVNRSTAEVGQDNTQDRGLRPLKSLFQSYMTREIVWDASFGGKLNNLAFRFADLSLDETMTKAQINKIALGAVGWKAVNEARAVEGRAPIGDPQAEDNIFNHILTNTPKGMLDLTTQEYVGEDQLAQIATKSKIDVAQAVADANPDAGPRPPGAGGPPPKQADDAGEMIAKAMTPFVDRQDQVLRAIESVASRAIEVNVQSAPAPNVEVHPATTEVNIAEGAVQVTVPPIEIAPATVNVTTPPLTIEKGAVQVTMPEMLPATAPNVQIDVHVPELKAGDVTVNTPAEIAITRMPTRATKRTVTKRVGGDVAEVQDVETDVP